MKKPILTVLLLSMVFSVLLCAGTEAHGAQSAAALIREIQTKELRQIDLGQVTFSPAELLQIRNALPPDGQLTFSTVWRKTVITEHDTEISLNGSRQSISPADLEALIRVCPLVKTIDVSDHRELSNNEMIPLLEKYPEVEFVWLINFAYTYTVKSNATAYSTFKHETTGKRLTSAALAPLKYAKNLKALDLGHHQITSLDFLEGLDLELIILADNNITDISALGAMKHLQYAELFMNPITDLSPLANCVDLLDLNITRNNVTDLSPLDSCTRLERLWASVNKKMGAETKNHFVETHPLCNANFTNEHSTSDGWRKHPRYAHYIACFKSTVWIPFEEGFTGSANQ